MQFNNENNHSAAQRIPLTKTEKVEEVNQNQASKNRRTTIQTVFFLRHGVAQHNLPPGKTQTGAYTRPDLMKDPPLVTIGMEQARNVGRKLRLLRKKHSGLFSSINTVSEEEITLDLVVASPLTRCLQTTSLVLERFYEVTTGEDPCAIICHEDLREAYGVTYSDKRSTKSQLVKSWPNCGFDPEMTEEDLDWHPQYRETMDHLLRRVHNVLFWLVNRNFQHTATLTTSKNGKLMMKNSSRNSDTSSSGICCNTVLLVTHGVWMETCFLHYCPDVLDGGKKRVHNCNLFCGNLVGFWEKDSINSKWQCVGISLENLQFLTDGQNCESMGALL